MSVFHDTLALQCADWENMFCTASLMLQINSVYFLTFTLAVLPFISTRSAREQKLLPDLQGRTTVALTWHFGASYIHRHPSWRLLEKLFSWLDACAAQQVPLPDGIKLLDLLF